MKLEGKNDGNGYDYQITVVTTTTRAKRDGRNPSTGAFAPNQSAKSVRDNYVVDGLLEDFVLDVGNYQPTIPKDELSD